MPTIVWYLLIALWLGISGPNPAALHRPVNDCGQRVQRKFYPIARRYRQLVQQQIDLPPLEPTCPCPLARRPAAALVPPVATLAPGTALDHLLMRIQV
jgi:hypothetical protein